MKLRCIALFVASAALLGSAFASNLRSTVNRFNTRVCASFLKNDGLKTFEKITRNSVTSDFKHVDGGNSTNYDQMLAEMKGAMAMMKITSAHSTTGKVSQKGNEGTAIVTHNMTGRMVGPDKKKHQFHMWGSSVDTLRREDGKWKLAEMKWTSTKMTMDGKPFDPSQMGGGK